MPKYIRKQPLSERIKAFLNPWDFLLWLSEELEANGWDRLEKGWTVTIGIIVNLIFIVARSNMNKKSRGYDDVFGDVRSSGWVAWMATFLVHSLTYFSILNAGYTFWKKKHYRLFENAVDVVPNTPSARRTRVDSSPVSSSPLRFLSTILGTDVAQSKAHGDPNQDVWEVAVWDPSPIALRLFCCFSPGHVILYWLFFPTTPTDPRPSTTVVTAISLTFIISVQLSMLSSRFSQQSKDSTLISKEVLHEYDTKYVRPRTQPLYRDVGTQFTEQASYSEHRDKKYNTVVTYTPMVVINRGFKPNPNPNYMSHVEPNAQNIPYGQVRPAPSSSFKTPAVGRDLFSPSKPTTAIRQPVFRPQGGLSDGGSLGVYSHAASPLKKSSSANFTSAKLSQQHEVLRERSNQSPERRPRMSVPAEGINTSAAVQRWGHLKADRTRRESGRI